jgi:hypothetical protein
MQSVAARTAGGISRAILARKLARQAKCTRLSEVGKSYRCLTSLQYRCAAYSQYGLKHDGPSFFSSTDPSRSYNALHQGLDQSSQESAAHASPGAPAVEKRSLGGEATKASPVLLLSGGVESATLLHLWKDKSVWPL